MRSSSLLLLPTAITSIWPPSARPYNSSLSNPLLPDVFASMPLPTVKNSLARVLLQAGLFETYTGGPRSFKAQDAHAYDVGVYGNYPEIPFNTTELFAPKILKRSWEPSCEADDDQYYFLAPYGFADYHPGPMILDSAGDLVWADQAYPQSYGFTVQHYKGEPYLTWWTGDDHARGHGIGSYYMVDSSYTQFKKIGAFNNFPADLHEFSITPENTGLITSYVSTKQDLRSHGGPQEGYIWDGVFQEFDIETNTLQFQWRASDHFDPHDCLSTLELEGTKEEGTKEEPWDFFHLNSIDKDNKGNYLISARYCALSYISGKTGEVLWHIGGKNNSFRDVSGGNASDFEFQHHARWTDSYNAITLFDNQANSDYERRIPSRGLKIAVDTREMTVGVLNEFVHPTGRIGFSQGSMQSLSNGNYLIGWGHTGAITEFRPNGEVACDLQFSPLQIGEEYTFAGGAAQSYRAFKHKWVGKPHYDPVVRFDREAAVYISWNGATEVRQWRLEGSVDRESWTLVGQTQKQGFETKMAVEAELYSLFRLTALDKQERIIGRWNVFSSNSVLKIVDREMVTVERGIGPFLGFLAFFLVLGGVCASLSGLAVFYVRRRRRGRHMLLCEKQFANINPDNLESETTSLTTSFDGSREDYESDEDKEEIETTKGSFI